MALKIYRDSPFNAGTEVDPIDTFTGITSQLTYNLVDLTGQRLASTVQFGGYQYYQYNGGFTKVGNSFTLSSGPPNNSQGIAPGLSSVLFDGLFDENVVEGLTNPRVKEVAFYLADVDEIHLKKYTNLPSLNGIQLCFVDLISSAGPDTSWVQLACASQDAAGTALTYGATGECLQTAALTAFGTLFASSAAGASSLFVDYASTFYIGDYIQINSGTITSEVVKIVSRSGQVLGVSGLDFDHYIGETVYACGRKFWAKVTVPVGATNGNPVNYYDVALRRRARIISRV